MNTDRQDLSLSLYNLTEKIFLLTLEILEQSNRKEVDKVIDSLNNRERLIGALNYLQEKINNKPNNLKKQLVEDSQKILRAIEDLDGKIIQNLENIKSETNVEIAKVFKTKENFKGYNLNKLK